MTDLTLDIKEFLRLAENLPVFDVRTPAEFNHAHIPGAISLPLFSNEERSVIGTLYIRKGSSDAIIKGLEFIRPRMKTFAETANRIAQGGEALMHCWRGGMRSNSMAWLMNTIGIKTYTLIGGYKSFRRYTAECFARHWHLIVIGGMTGSGKTDIIKGLKSKGIQAIDLEALAVHKGSVFGGIGLPRQPTTEQFENYLFSELVKLDPDKPIFIEDESLSIGRVFIPRKFYEQMSVSAYIRLNVDFNIRHKNLLDSYSSGSREDLISAVKKIEKRLGTEHTATAVKLIQSGDLPSAAEIILRYYDKIYSRSMNLHTHERLYEIQAALETPAEIGNMILSKLNQWN